ncbi:MAG: SusC/RagA family TonB-linked outer membrane protein [Bacteroidota bacterium]
MKKLFYLTFLLLLAGQAMAQIRVTGKVISQDDNAVLPGVSVVIKGTTKGTISDASTGTYEIQVPDQSTVLVFSFIGYQNQEVAVGTRTTIDVGMLPDVTQLSEVVVTALGISKEKAKLGYAVQELNADKIQATSQGNLLSAINGKVAGIQIVNSSSAPGSTPSVVIRGMSSLNNNRPLYVVNGVPVISGGNFNDTDYVSSDGTMDINPNDVASITVLKGASATALYGSRAQNGAIIITTKDGSNNTQNFGIDLKVSHSVDKVTQLPDVYWGYDLGSSGNRVYTSGSWGPRYDQQAAWGANPWGFDPAAQLPTLHYDNVDRFWNTGNTDETGVGISGKSAAGNFYTGYTNFKQKGTIPDSEYERHSFSFNGANNLTDKLKIGGAINYTFSNAHNPRIGYSGLVNALYCVAPWVDVRAPYYDEQGKHTFPNLYSNHPMQLVKENNTNTSVNRFIGNMNADYKITDAIGLSYRVGADFRNTIEDYYREKGLGIWAIDAKPYNEGLGAMWESRTNQLDYNMDVILRGTKDLSADLELSGMIGFNYYGRNYTNRYAYGDSLLIKGFRDMSNLAKAKEEYFTDDYQQRKFGYYADATLSYKQYLNISGTARYDLTSTLPRQNRGYWYWSTNVGFILSELVDLPKVSFAKIRASVATVGNDTFAERIIEKTFLSNSIFNNPRASVMNSLIDKNLKNEKTLEWEIGADLQFFDGKIGLDAAFYNRSTINQIVSAPITGSSGYTTLLTNGGNIRNRGLEVMLSFNDVISAGDFHWDAAFNFTRNRNKVVEVSEQFGNEYTVASIGYPGPMTIVAKKGQPYGVITGPDYKRDANGNVLLSDAGRPLPTADYVPLGNMNPNFTLGITNTFRFKGFTLSALLDIKNGGDLVNGTRGDLIYSGRDAITKDRYYSATSADNVTKVFDGIIESSGEVSNIPVRLDRTYYRWLGTSITSILVEDASWVRLRDISLSYSLPAGLLSKTPFKGAELTIAGRNIWYKTNYSGVDPEFNSFGSGSNVTGGYDYYSLPSTKSYAATLKLKF